MDDGKKSASPSGTPKTKPQGPQDLGTAFSKLQDMAGPVTAFLEGLVILDRYEIQDITGAVHTFAPVLTARRQIEASIRMDAMIATQVALAPEAEEKVKATVTSMGRMAALRTFLELVIEREETQERLQELFVSCHPRLYQEAVANAEKAWAEGGQLQQLWADDGYEEPPRNVLDLFEVDALLVALVPFFARFATRIGRALTLAETKPKSGRPRAIESPSSSLPSPSPLSES